MTENIILPIVRPSTLVVVRHFTVEVIAVNLYSPCAVRDALNEAIDRQRPHRAEYVSLTTPVWSLHDPRRLMLQDVRPVKQNGVQKFYRKRENYIAEVVQVLGVAAACRAVTDPETIIRLIAELSKTWTPNP